MYLIPPLTALSIVIQCIISQSSATPDGPTPTNQPPDLSGEDTPHRAIPTGNDAPPGATGNVAVQNILGKILYGCNGCKRIPGGKDKIDGAYHDSWIMVNTVEVASNVDCLKFLVLQD